MPNHHSFKTFSLVKSLNFVQVSALPYVTLVSMTLFPSHSESPWQGLVKEWVHNQVLDHEMKRMCARWLRGVFLAVKERTQEETVSFCFCWPEWAASNSFCYRAVLPACGWRPQKEAGGTETSASRWSHPTVKCPLRGGKCPNCFCQFEVKILSLEARVIFMGTIKFFLNCLNFLFNKKVN